MIEVVSYDCILDSIFDDNTTITARYSADAEEGDFIMCDGFAGVIKAISVAHGEMSLTCQGMDAAFDRTLRWEKIDTEGMTTEELVEKIFADNYINCDPMYAMPYIEFNNNERTELKMPTRNNEGLYTVTAYFRKLRKAGIGISYDLTGNKLIISLSGEKRSTRNIDFVAHNTVTAEAYGGYATAKVTNYPRVDVEGENGTEQVISDVPVNYYLLSDGTVTQDENDTNRIYGVWEVTIGAEESAVLEKFTATYGHEIKFSGTTAYSLYTPVRLRMPSGKVVISYISRIQKKSNDENYYYTAGELKTTLTAKLKK